MTVHRMTLVGLSIGILVGAAFTTILFLVAGPDTETGAAGGQEKEPLYWVAPMDPNYRRDEPGQSPMGMDLIPVYEEGVDGGAGPGTIRISPDVVNNLGVRTAPVERGQLDPQIDTVGYLQANQDELVHINPRIEGWIEKLSVNTAGDRVTEGQPLYALYSPELVNVQQEFLQALQQGNPGFIRAAEDRLKAWQVSDRFVQALRRDKQVRQTVTYYAPQDGYVEALNVRQGEFVQPGKVLMSLAKLENIWVEAEVFANQAHLVEVGLPATMTLDYLPQKAWQGEVDYVYPTLNPKTRTLPVRLKFSNEDGELKPNMFAHMAIHGRTETDTLLVPKEAVIRTGEMNRVVLALGDGQFKSVEVSLGRRDDQYVEILEGVEAGERVVTSAQFLLDSESSKTSDFKRLHHGEEADVDAAASDVVETEATINSVMPDMRMINVTHAPIEAWDWPEMTMDFEASEEVELSGLQQGSKVRLEIEKTDDGGYVVNNIRLHDGEQSDATDSDIVTTEATVNSVMPGMRMLNVTHAPIEAWGWPEMTMDFDVSEQVELSGLKQGSKVQLEIEKTEDGGHLVTGIRLADDSSGDNRKTKDSMDMNSDMRKVDREGQE